MPIIPPSPDKYPRKSRPPRFLDEAFLAQRLLLRQAQDTLRCLAQDTTLPGEMRPTCAGMALRLGKMGRTLARQNKA